MNHRVFFLCPAFAFALAGCGAQREASAPVVAIAANVAATATSAPASAPAATTSAAASPLRFTDVTREAGITFKHHNGAFGARFMPESMGSGVACIDYDGDGDQDLFFVNSRDWTEAELNAYRNGNGRKHAEKYKFVLPKRPPVQHVTGALYRNDGRGHFEDVTRGSGLDVEMFGMGTAVGDYDNDGDADLYVTGYGRNFLFRNEKGRFVEVSATAGVRESGLSTSAAWLDYDKDGKLDLFVCRYVGWTPAREAYVAGLGFKVYSGPVDYPGDFSHLYHNEGNGRFKDVSKSAGIIKRQDSLSKLNGEPELRGRALGIVVCDYDNDLWQDIVVANDRSPNFLFRNNHDGTFSEVALRAGISIGPFGRPRAGMGIDAADIDHSNRESLVIANFTYELLGIYQNMGHGLFNDIVPGSRVEQDSKMHVSFGALFTDLDNDGWPDLIVTNGHVNDLIHKGNNPQKTHAQQMLIFRNVSAQAQSTTKTVKKSAPTAQFEEVGKSAGAALGQYIVGRGLASADFDGDGDNDLVVTANGGPARLLRNDSENGNNVIRVKLQGIKSNRDGIGGVVWGEIGSDTVRRRVQSGSSYLSQSELVASIGLGKNSKAREIVIRWPSDKLMSLPNIDANQTITVNEDKGIVRREPITRP